MRTHTILGAGNLGHSLLEACPDGAYLNTPWRYPKNSVKEILNSAPDFVWCCIGGGSVNEAKADFSRVLLAHLNIPLELALFLPAKTRLIVFSTDYVADESDPGNPTKTTPQCRSLYARSKLAMEKALMALPQSAAQVRVVRVGSLYGRKFPHKSFPGRLMSRFVANGQNIQLPANRVTPTSTDWLAVKLHKNIDRLFEAPGVVHHLAPRGNWSVCGWGRTIIPMADIAEGPVDLERPAVSDLGCDWLPEEPLEDVYRRYPPRSL